jgi:hypothetical protein
MAILVAGPQAPSSMLFSCEVSVSANGLPINFEAGIFSEMSTLSFDPGTENVPDLPFIMIFQFNRF